NGTFCWDWVHGHWGDILQPRLLEHLELTVIAVGIGFAIAFSAALLAHRRRWFETPFSTFSAFLYTIPSLALFQLLVPFTGLTKVTIEIGLVGYTLLILFRNILEGLRSVPRDVLEAAHGMGLTGRQILLRIELPLAFPAISAGVRIAVVTFAFDTFKPHTFVDAFRFMADNPGLMWQKTVEHLQISGEAMGIALLIAIPLGVFLGHIHRGSFISINLANIGRALPSLAVI